MGGSAGVEAQVTQVSRETAAALAKYPKEKGGNTERQVEPGGQLCSVRYKRLEYPNQTGCAGTVADSGGSAGGGRLFSHPCEVEVRYQWT